MPLVTIVVATYNRSALLKLALKTILRQEFADFEVQIVGDACTDDTAEVVASLGDPRLIWSNLKTRVGNQAGPNNEGIRRAKGKYIAYLGHDDLWFPLHLKNLVKHLEDGAQYAFSLSALIGPEEIRAYGTPDPKRKLEYHFAPPSTWIHTRELIEKIGNWRTDAKNLLFTVDRELFHRAVKRGITPIFSPHLSVLKFPSAFWKTYARTEFPQEVFAEKMKEDPEQLQIELLNKIAAKSSLHWENQKSFPRKKLCSLLDIYGRERWPVSVWMNRKLGKEIDRRAALRGLINTDTKTTQHG